MAPYELERDTPLTALEWALLAFAALGCLLIGAGLVWAWQGFGGPAWAVQWQHALCDHGYGCPPRVIGYAAPY